MLSVAQCQHRTKPHATQRVVGRRSCSHLPQGNVKCSASVKNSWLQSKSAGKPVRTTDPREDRSEPASSGGLRRGRHSTGGAARPVEPRGLRRSDRARCALPSDPRSLGGEPNDRSRLCDRKRCRSGGPQSGSRLGRGGRDPANRRAVRTSRALRPASDRGRHASRRLGAVGPTQLTARIRAARARRAERGPRPFFARRAPLR